MAGVANGVAGIPRKWRSFRPGLTMPQTTAIHPLPASAGSPLLAAGSLVLVAAFAPTWLSFIPVWSEYFSHGFAVLLFTGWMLWSAREELGTPGEAWLPGILPLLALSLTWMLLMAAGVQVLHQVLAPIILALWMLTVGGRQRWRTVLRILGFFLLAAPIWRLAIPALQAITVAANAVFLRLWHLEATVRGNLITIPNGTFEVAQSCAGEAFFMSGLTIAVAYNEYFKVSRRAALAVVAIGVGLSIVSNWVRVFGLILIGHYAGMDHSLVQDHGWYGWVLFACVQVLFFAIAPRLEHRWPPNPNAVAGLSSMPGTVRPVTLVVGTLAALAGPLALWSLSRMPLSPVPDAVPGVAMKVAPKELTPQAWRPRVTGFTEHRTYAVRVDSIPVQVDRFVFSAQEQGRELVNEMNRFVPDSLLLDDRVIGPIDSSLRIVHQLGVQDGGRHRVVWYWYHVGGRNTASPVRAKLFEMLTFLTRASPSELVMASAACETPQCRESLTALGTVVTGQRGSSADTSR